MGEKQQIQLIEIDYRNDIIQWSYPKHKRALYHVNHGITGLYLDGLFPVSLFIYIYNSKEFRKELKEDFNLYPSEFIYKLIGVSVTEFY